MIIAGVLGAIAGVAVTATVMSSPSYNKAKSSPSAAVETSGFDDSNASASLPPDIEDEVFSRNKSFFGEEGFQEIKKSFVVVVGLGGVGSHAAHMLARSGVGKMRVVDFDQVTTNNIQ